MQIATATFPAIRIQNYEAVSHNFSPTHPRRTRLFRPTPKIAWWLSFQDEVRHSVICDGVFYLVCKAKATMPWSDNGSETTISWRLVYILSASILTVNILKNMFQEKQATLGACVWLRRVVLQAIFSTCPLVLARLTLERRHRLGRPGHLRAASASRHPSSSSLLGSRFSRKL